MQQSLLLKVQLDFTHEATSCLRTPGWDFDDVFVSGFLGLRKDFDGYNGR